MSDILRFQVSRAPQRRVPDDATLVKLLDFNDLLTVAAKFLTSPAEKEKHVANIPHAGGGNLTRLVQEAMMLLVAPLAQRRTLARTVVLSPESVGQPQSTPLLSVVPELDRWLMTHDDMPDSAALQKELDVLGAGIRARSSADPGTSALEAIVLDPEFWGDHIRLERMLAATIMDNDPLRTSFDVRARIVRLVLVAALIEDMALAAKLPASAEVFRMLRRRTISLPERLLAPLRRPNPSIRRPGFSDLFVVRENWLRYEAGEIAHIENVLAHELKERIHQRIDEQEVTTLIESSESKMSERDTQTTERLELQTAASEELSVALAVEGSIDTKSMLPSTTIDVHIGGSVESSYSQSNSRASTTAREVVSRAAERVQTAVRRVRTQRTLSRVTETNTHTLDNKKNDKHVTGIYRWVDKVKRMELVRYPNRFLIELHIPEPGSWLRWAFQQANLNPDLPPNPGTFTTIQPDDITFDNPVLGNDYRRLAALYGAREIKPPPTRQILPALIHRDPVAGEKEVPFPEIEIPVHYYKGTGPTVPAGMVATTWQARIASSEKADPALMGGVMHDPTGRFAVNVGTGSAQTQINVSAENVELTGNVGDITSGSIPISVAATFDFGFAIHVAVTFEPTAAAITAWKMETYEALRDAHAQAAQRYREAKATAETMRSVAFDSMPPAKSRQLMTSEMKRSAIELLLGEEWFAGRSGIMVHIPTGEPSIEHGSAAKSAPLIQFMEQAFEWGNMTWMLYPYFWAARGTDPRPRATWRPLAFQQSADPDLDAFLGAGAARLVVSARPGFEAQVQLFLEYGILWGGGPVPGPGDAGYVSVADEIRSMQLGASDGVITDTWDISLPTTLVILDADSRMPVKNPAYPEP